MAEQPRSAAGSIQKQVDHPSAKKHYALGEAESVFAVERTADVTLDDTAQHGDRESRPKTGMLDQ